MRHNIRGGRKLRDRSRLAAPTTPTGRAGASAPTRPHRRESSRTARPEALPEALAAPLGSYSPSSLCGAADARACATAYVHVGKQARQPRDWRGRIHDQRLKPLLAKGARLVLVPDLRAAVIGQAGEVEQRPIDSQRVGPEIVENDRETSLPPRDLDQPAEVLSEPPDLTISEQSRIPAASRDRLAARPTLL
jgi:hypothetical protein